MTDGSKHTRHGGRVRQRSKDKKRIASENRQKRTLQTGPGMRPLNRKRRRVAIADRTSVGAHVGGVKFGGVLYRCGSLTWHEKLS